MEYNQRKEINEAIQAADQTLSYLVKAQKYLDSAGNWGIFDMLGGGFITTMIKHGKMRDAEDTLTAAKDSIQSLKKELNDINQIIDVNLDIGDFLYFADYFFDGLVTDWMVQSKVREA